MKARIFFSLPIFLLGFASLALSWPPPMPGVPELHRIAQPEYIAGQIQYNTRYPFINYAENYFEWHSPASMLVFFQKLSQAGSRKVRILHIGDSHVQADIFTGFVRNRLQDIFGTGGRGMMFPYAVANTHSAYDYYTFKYGEWAFQRNVRRLVAFDLGTSGATGFTREVGAGFRMVFNKYYFPADNHKMRIYCKCDEKSFAMRVRINDSVRMDTLTCENPADHYVDLLLHENPMKVEVTAIRTSPEQDFLQIHGVQLQTREDQGMLYESVGINGADFEAILRQNRMEMELGSIRPDLVVLDISGNEYFAGGLNTATFADRLREVIARVKSGAPDAAILVTCSQDINRYRTTPHKDCGPAATLARMVAYETGCGFYDYHKVSGGCNSMNKWFAHGLAKLDRVHLSNEGYYLKGELFSNALLTTYHQFLIGQHVSPFQAAFLPEPQFGKVAPVQNYNVVNYSTAVASSGAVTNHTVRSGEVLGTIANRYGVAVDDIRRWNGIRGDLIRVGQVLKIYGTSPTAPAASAKTGNAPPAPKPTPAPTTRPAAHTVQSGESLWVISRKYDMTVDELLRLNALGRNDKIHPGQKLKLK